MQSTMQPVTYSLLLNLKSDAYWSQTMITAFTSNNEIQLF